MSPFPITIGPRSSRILLFNLCPLHIMSFGLDIAKSPITLTFQTSSSAKSIWQGLSQDQLHQNVMELKLKTDTPSEIKRFDEHNWLNLKNIADHDHLPISTERRLANNLAFLADGDDGVKTVSAVVLEVAKDPYGSPSLTVRHAVNEVVVKGYAKTLRNIFDLLALCSKRGKSSIFI